MSPKKRIGPECVITSIHQGLFTSQNNMMIDDDDDDSQTEEAVIRSPSQPSVMPENSSKNKSKREGLNEAHKSARPTQPLNLERHSCPSIRRLQAKMEIEKQQMKETMDQLLNTEKGFVKELEDVLNHHERAELRRRELIHKHWTERLWLPLQKQLNLVVSSCGAAEIKRRQSLYSQYLQHCNSKGYVFLDTFNTKEYDPFLHQPKKSRYYVKLAEIKTAPKEVWTSNYLKTDSKNSSREEEKLPHRFQSSLFSSSSATPGARARTPTSYSASTFTKTPTENQAVRRALSRHSFYTDSVEDWSRKT